MYLVIKRCSQQPSMCAALQCLPENGGAVKAMRSSHESRATREARHSEGVGGFPGGSMKAFEDAAKAATEQVLRHWAAQLRQHSIRLPHGSKGPLVYMFVTDLRMTPVQHARHEALALAGHKLASRLVFVDEDQHNTFYEIANALTGRLGKAVNS